MSLVSFTNKCNSHFYSFLTLFQAEAWQMTIYMILASLCASGHVLVRDNDATNRIVSILKGDEATL